MLNRKGTITLETERLILRKFVKVCVYKNYYILERLIIILGGLRKLGY